VLVTKPKLVDAYSQYFPNATPSFPLVGCIMRAVASTSTCMSELVLYNTIRSADSLNFQASSVLSE